MPNLLSEMPGLLAEAEALGWDRILIEAHQVFGVAAFRSMRWELARDHFQKAIPRTRPEVRDGHGIYPAIPLIFQR